jgi:hypothetical protein
MSKIKVLIMVEGGCITEVISNSNEVEYLVKDWDAIKSGDAERFLDTNFS